MLGFHSRPRNDVEHLLGEAEKWISAARHSMTRMASSQGADHWGSSNWDKYVEPARREASSLSRMFQRTYNHYAPAVADTADDAWNRAVSGGKSAADTVQRHPLAFLAVAVGLGLLASALGRR